MPSSGQSGAEDASGAIYSHKTKSHAWVLRLGGLSTWELTKRVLSDARADDVLGWAAQLSFYLILAFFPLVIFACSMAGALVANQNQFSHWMLQYMRPVMPHAAFHLLRSTVDEILKTQHTRVVSLLFALWSASYGLEALITGINVAFDVREYRKWWKRRLLAIAMTVILAIGASCAVILIVWGGQLSNWLADREGPAWLFRTAWPFVRWTLVIALLFVAVILIYRFAPNLKKQSLLSVLPGAIVAIVLWIGASLVFRFYVAKFFSSYQRLYGSLAALMVVLLWLYMSSVALLVGAEVNSEIRWAAKDAGDPSAREALQENRER